MHSAAMNQPPEVLQNIMEELIGPDVVLPFTGRPLLHVTGHPRAKILPLIYLCKSWYLGGVRLLYRDILITSLSQISGLSETLQKVECSGLRAWVESIEIQNLYPDEIASSTFQAEIHMLLRICPNLTKFAYTHTCRSRDIFYSPVYPWLTAPITHLHLQYVASRQELIVALKETSLTLLSLYLSFATGARAGDWLALRFSMPQLHTLSVPQCQDTFLLCETWDMPSLTRLLLWHSQEYESNSWSIYKVNQGLEAFKPLGKNLKVLQVWPDGRFTNLNRLLEYTPRLNHLIFYHCENDSESFLKAISHPRLQWIDIWANNNSTGRTVERLRQLNYRFSFPVSERRSAGGSGIGMPSLPAIRGVRVFPAYLREWSHLPLILTPTESPEVQVVQFMSSQDLYSWYRWVMDSRVYPEEDIDSDDSDYPEPEENDEEDTEIDSTDSEGAGSEDEEDLDLKASALNVLRIKNSVFV